MGNRHEPDFLSTETIDLNSVFTRDVASSGTFDLRGLEATSLGKLLQTIPIPALLVDGACAVAFANQASTHIGVSGSSRQPGSFASLFADAAAAAGAEALIRKVFATRRPEVLEAPLKKGRGRLWGRMHLRPLRMGKRRSVLVIVEDLTVESNRVLLEEKHLKKMERSQDMTERRLARSAANLKMANSLLRKEAAKRKRIEEELRKANERLLLQSELVDEETGTEDISPGKKARGRKAAKATQDSEHPRLASDRETVTTEDFRNFLQVVRSVALTAWEDLDKQEASVTKRHLEELLRHCAVADDRVACDETPNASVRGGGS